MSKPIILVTGATGAQGGSVVRYLLEDNKFSIRAVTRNPDSAKAKELAAKGVEVVKGDFDDPTSIQNAFTGVYGAFVVTDFWGNYAGFLKEPAQGKNPAHAAAEQEIEQGKILVDAAKAAGVKYFIFSTLERPAITVPHWNSKAAIDEYLKASGIPTSSIYTAFYFQNFRDYLPLRKSDNGELVADWPAAWTDGPIPALDIDELGAYAREAFNNPEKWIGSDLRVVHEIVTPRTVVDELRKLSDVPIRLIEYGQKEFERSKDVPELEELYLNMKWFYIREGDINAHVAITRVPTMKAKSFQEWAKEHVSELVAS